MQNRSQVHPTPCLYLQGDGKVSEWVQALLSGALK